MLVVAVINVDAYPFLAFSDLTCHLQDTEIGVFWLHCATSVRKPNSSSDQEAFHQQVKTLR